MKSLSLPALFSEPIQRNNFVTCTLQQNHRANVLPSSRNLLHSGVEYEPLTIGKRNRNQYNPPSQESVPSIPVPSRVSSRYPWQLSVVRAPEPVQLLHENTPPTSRERFVLASPRRLHLRDVPLHFMSHLTFSPFIPSLRRSPHARVTLVSCLYLRLYL